jgi:hypothetical protein
MQAPPPPPPLPLKPPPPPPRVKLSAEERAARADLEAKRGIDALKERLALAKAALYARDRLEDAKLDANLLDQGVNVLNSVPPASVVSQDDDAGTHTDATHVDMLSHTSADSGSIGLGGSGGDSNSSSLLAGNGSHLLIVRANPSLALRCTTVRTPWNAVSVRSG